LRSHWRFLVSSLFGYFEAERLGEAFLEQAFTLHADFVARMLRAYKNRDLFPEITKDRFPVTPIRYP
jgi:hypothetical protein